MITAYTPSSIQHWKEGFWVSNGEGKLWGKGKQEMSDKYRLLFLRISQMIRNLWV